MYIFAHMHWQSPKYTHLKIQKCGNYEYLKRTYDKNFHIDQLFSNKTNISCFESWLDPNQLVLISRIISFVPKALTLMNFLKDSQNRHCFWAFSLIQFSQQSKQTNNKNMPEKIRLVTSKFPYMAKQFVSSKIPIVSAL